MYVTGARLTAGKVRIRNDGLYRETMASWPDGELVITIEPRHATRSNQQNRWYWGVIVEQISEKTGFDPDETHEVLKARFLPKKLALCDGNGEIQGEYVIGGSTTKLDKVQFGEYCEAIRRWAAESLELQIPDPMVAS